MYIHMKAKQNFHCHFHQVIREYATEGIKLIIQDMHSMYPAIARSLLGGLEQRE